MSTMAEEILLYIRLILGTWYLYYQENMSLVVIELTKSKPSPMDMLKDSKLNLFLKVALKSMASIIRRYSAMLQK